MLSFLDSIVSFFTTIFDFLVSIIQNAILLLKLVQDVITLPSLLSSLVFQPLAVCIVVVCAVAVLKNVLGRV